MGALLQRIRHTKPSSAVGLVRVTVGLLFLSTGIMKIAVPSLRIAFAGQLSEAGLPLHSVNLRLVPLVEIVIGGMLIVGFFGRISSLVVILMMTVATYVHLVAHNPELFPLQPEAPIIPLLTILLSGWCCGRAAGPGPLISDGRLESHLTSACS